MDKYEILNNDYEDGIYRKSLYKCTTCGYNALIRHNMVSTLKEFQRVIAFKS
jgi:hypothetical protein